MTNYRICFDFAAEEPRKAIIYMLGTIEDPAMQTMPLNWLVIDQDTGEEHHIRCSLHHIRCSLVELDIEVTKDLGKLLKRLSKTEQNPNSAPR
jgi:hypothetical protein